MIKTDNIARALIGLVEDDGRDSSEVADNFVKFAKKYNMETRVKNVLAVIEDKAKNTRERETVFIKTAREVPERLLKEIKKHLEIPEDAPVNISFDENILGGFRVLYKDNLYEYSLGSRLKKLKTKLTE